MKQGFQRLRRAIFLGDTLTDLGQGLFGQNHPGGDDQVLRDLTQRLQVMLTRQRADFLARQWSATPAAGDGGSRGPIF